MDEFIILETLADANNLCLEIQRIKKLPGPWAVPIKHPLNDEFIVPIDRNRLMGCEHLLPVSKTIRRVEAIKKGWYFGPFTGKLAREKDKLEDIHFLFDAIVEAYGKPNFPAFRSLVLSFL